MISTAISITKYENEAALEERREEEVDDDDDDDNDSVEKAAGAHNTRAGAAYLLAKTQSILRKIRFPERRQTARPGRVPISLSYLLPTTSSLASPPFVTDGLKSNDGFLPSFPFFTRWWRRGSFFRIILLLSLKFLFGSLSLPTALTIRDCFFSSSASFGEIGV